MLIIGGMTFRAQDSHSPVTELCRFLGRCFRITLFWLLPTEFSPPSSHTLVTAAPCLSPKLPLAADALNQSCLPAPSCSARLSWTWAWFLFWVRQGFQSTSVLIFHRVTFKTLPKRLYPRPFSTELQVRFSWSCTTGLQVGSSGLLKSAGSWCLFQLSSFCSATPPSWMPRLIQLLT